MKIFLRSDDAFVFLPSQHFPDKPVDISYDYEMLPSRRPKFLAQSAAHVAGAARYYQQSDIQDPPWGQKVEDPVF